MDLNESCQQTRESWLDHFADAGDSDRPTNGDGAAQDPSHDWTSHLESCPDCAEFTQKVDLDQKRLRAYFAEAHVPGPEPLDFRQPLHAASGHPRRISLSILPLLLALLLVLVLAILAFTWVKATQEDGALERKEKETVETAATNAPDVLAPEVLAPGHETGRNGTTC